MDIIDEEPKKEPPKLEPGDVIRAEFNDNKYYFMISKISNILNDLYCCVQLNGNDGEGKITLNGRDTKKLSDKYYRDIDDMIDAFKVRGFTNIEKVELEARVKHESIQS